MLYVAVIWSLMLYAGLEAISWSSGQTYDLCKTKNLQISAIGGSGNITFDRTSLSDGLLSGRGCVLKIESCSACRLEIKPMTDQQFPFFCETGQTNLKYCSIGCDYLSIFDMYYMEETSTYYKTINNVSKTFTSESSNVFIMICHGGIPKYNFNISFKTLEKLETITGQSGYEQSGYLNSPFFPNSYAQNHEVYTFHISSTKPTDYIKLTFDDWHMSDTATLYFEGSNRLSQVEGTAVRPVVVSDKNWLKISFNTGLSFTAGENRNYIGFRATYLFFSSDPVTVTQPKTDCDGPSYYMDSVGGKIEFSPKSVTGGLYDCLWVVKTKEGYDGLYLKIIKFQPSNSYLFRGQNELTLKEGIVSTGRVVDTVDILDSVDNGLTHLSSQGFYIRLNASTMTISHKLVIAFASYKERRGCGGTMYVCNNGRCIDPALKCDGIDHCGDSTDERQGCQGSEIFGGDSHYQYTITIGVIVPMVISVFLVMVICLLFVMIRRCRRAQLRQMAESSERLPSISEEVSERRGHRRRRRRRGLFGHIERDLPPTYDEAIQNPPGWYLNVAFGNPVDPTLPQPPSYLEAVGQDVSALGTSQLQPPGSPTSTSSSQSELTVCSGNLSDSSSSSDEGSSWGAYMGDGEGRRGRLGRHRSSGESDSGTGRGPRPPSVSTQDQGETRPLCVAASRDNLQNTSSDRAGIVENIVKPENSKNTENTKVTKKISHDADDFVVPSGSKPGGSDLQVHENRPPSHNAGPASQDSGPHPRVQPSHPSARSIHKGGKAQIRDTPSAERSAMQDSGPHPRPQTRAGPSYAMGPARKEFDPHSKAHPRSISPSKIRQGLGAQPRAQPRQSGPHVTNVPGQESYPKSGTNPQSPPSNVRQDSPFIPITLPESEIRIISPGPTRYLPAEGIMQDLDPQPRDQSRPVAGSAMVKPGQGSNPNLTAQQRPSREDSSDSDSNTGSNKSPNKKYKKTRQTQQRNKPKDYAHQKPVRSDNGSRRREGSDGAAYIPDSLHKESNPRKQSDIDSDKTYNIVTNVDNDDIMFVESQNKTDDKNSEGNYRRQFKPVSEALTSTRSLHIVPGGRSERDDDLVLAGPAGSRHLRSSSDELGARSDNRAHERLHRSYISLNADLEEMKDMYV